MAGPDDGRTCVDLGAGKGTITEAALRRSGPVIAIEIDPRLVARLRDRFGSDPRVSIVEGDLMRVPPPKGPFVVAANPPFNQSTVLVRRWLFLPGFASGALIVERAFARRTSGAFGTTKLSLAIAPYVELRIGMDVRGDEFAPRPRVPVAVLQAERRETPLVPWDERHEFWAFVNYLFERSRLTLGEALDGLSLPAMPVSLRDTEVRDLDVSTAAELHWSLVGRGPRAVRKVASFNASLPATRQMAFGDDVADDRQRSSGRQATSRPTHPRG